MGVNMEPGRDIRSVSPYVRAALDFRKCFLCSASVRRLPSEQKKRNIQPCQSILGVSPSVNLNLKMPNGRGRKSLLLILVCRHEHRADRDYFPDQPHQIEWAGRAEYTLSVIESMNTEKP